MSNKATDIANLLAPTVQLAGLELLGVRFVPAPGGATVRIYIDVPTQERDTRSVGIDDCERVSRDISAQLDVADPIQGNYTLEVSSPGVDRPLFTLAHFSQHIGQEVRLVLKVPLHARRKIQGHIAEVDLKTCHIVVLQDADSFVIPFNTIDQARIVPDWHALGLASPSKQKKGKKAAGQRRIKPSNGAPDGAPRAE